MRHICGTPGLPAPEMRPVRERRLAVVAAEVLDHGRFYVQRGSVSRQDAPGDEEALRAVHLPDQASAPVSSVAAAAKSHVRRRTGSEDSMVALADVQDGRAGNPVVE